MWSPGPLYDGKAHLTLDRWHFWKNVYRAVAAGGGEEKERYSKERRNVAAKAAALMDALEMSMTFSAIFRFRASVPGRHTALPLGSIFLMQRAFYKFLRDHYLHLLSRAAV